MKLTRRNFLNTTGILGATALATGGIPATTQAQTLKPRAPRIQLGVCTYSYWHLEGPKVPIAQKSRSSGVGKVEIGTGFSGARTSTTNV